MIVAYKRSTNVRYSNAVPTFIHDGEDPPPLPGEGLQAPPPAPLRHRVEDHSEAKAVTRQQETHGAHFRVRSNAWKGGGVKREGK